MSTAKVERIRAGLYEYRGCQVKLLGRQRQWLASDDRGPLFLCRTLYGAVDFLDERLDK